MPGVSQVGRLALTVRPLVWALSRLARTVRDQRSTGCFPQRDQHPPKHEDHGLDGEAEWDPGDTR